MLTHPAAEISFTVPTGKRALSCDKPNSHVTSHAMSCDNHVVGLEQLLYSPYLILHLILQTFCKHGLKSTSVW